MSILEVSGLRKVYTTRFGGSRVEALHNVEFTVEQGEYVAIMGESICYSVLPGICVGRANMWPSWANPAPARPRC